MMKLSYFKNTYFVRATLLFALLITFIILNISNIIKILYLIGFIYYFIKFLKGRNNG